MAERPERSEEYVSSMREAVLLQHAAVYCALSHRPEDSAAHQLAKFMLQEAGWDKATFLSEVLVRLGDA